MVKVEEVYNIYEYFCRQVLDRPDYDFYPTKREVTSIQNFTNLINEKYPLSVGPDWFYRYFSLQFSYYDSKYIKTPVAKIEWIAGKKALTRWEEKRDDYWYWAKKYAKTKKISVNMVQYILHGEVKVEIKVFKREELLKEKYLNTDRGLTLCLLDTTLINPKSKICDKCKFAKVCKDLLLKNIPNLHELRYEKSI